MNDVTFGLIQKQPKDQGRTSGIVIPTVGIISGVFVLATSFVSV